MSSASKTPDASGFFGEFGGAFVPESLLPALDNLEKVFRSIQDDPPFWETLQSLLQSFGGRPTPLYHAENLSKQLGINLYLKREDLNHTGAHKINNALGQILLAQKIGKKRIIAETGAGQHGVATATVAAKFGMQCVIYMGKKDIERQRLNVIRMELLGAEVRPVESGSETLKDATNEAIRDWVANVEDTHYLIGSVVGPHPYPLIVREFQRIIGVETRQQLSDLGLPIPDVMIACVGGGSNSIGLFHEFIDDNVRLVGVEAAGFGIDTNKHAATLTLGSPGVLHGSLSYLLQSDDGQVVLPHSISAGLDYPGVGPELSYLKDNSRVEFISVTDDEALDAFKWLSREEGIIPALESSHALAALKGNKIDLTGVRTAVLCLSGRGDKDVESVDQMRGQDQA